MVDKTVPWWRRALQFALGGIRTGFGLFQRGAKAGEAEEREPVRGVEAEETGESEHPVGVAEVPVVGEKSKEEPFRKGPIAEEPIAGELITAGGATIAGGEPIAEEIAAEPIAEKNRTQG